MRSDLDLNTDGKAIQFIQAEKMIYETALIDTSLLQTKVGNVFSFHPPFRLFVSNEAHWPK